MEGGYHVQSALLCDPRRAVPCGLKIFAVFDQLDAQRAHCGILLDAVAVRHDDRRGYAVLARGIAHRLAMIAARGADDAGGAVAAPRKIAEINQPSAQLERADRRVVLVPDPDLRPDRGF